MPTVTGELVASYRTLALTTFPEQMLCVSACVDYHACALEADCQRLACAHCCEMKEALWHRGGGDRSMGRSFYRKTRVDRTGEAAQAHRRHAELSRDLTERAEPLLLVPAERDYWMARLGHAQDNIRASLAWSISAGGVPAVGVDLAGALGGTG